MGAEPDAACGNCSRQKWVGEGMVGGGVLGGECWGHNRSSGFQRRAIANEFRCLTPPFFRPPGIFRAIAGILNARKTTSRAVLATSINFDARLLLPDCINTSSRLICECRPTRNASTHQHYHLTCKAYRRLPPLKYP